MRALLCVCARPKMTCRTSFSFWYLISWNLKFGILELQVVFDGVWRHCEVHGRAVSQLGQPFPLQLRSERRGGFHQWGNDDDDDDDDVEWRNHLLGSCRFCRRKSQVRQQDKQPLACWPVEMMMMMCLDVDWCHFTRHLWVVFCFVGHCLIPWVVNGWMEMSLDSTRKKKNIFSLLFSFFLTNGQEDWGYCRTGERISFFL